jgi:hypothetical protein
VRKNAGSTVVAPDLAREGGERHSPQPNLAEEGGIRAAHNGSTVAGSGSKRRGSSDPERKRRGSSRK